ncbi:hypothetical protein CPB84DRAFT_1555614 [Gymnopilus junonius]|uniref:Uncharacterized protein n=1 Tax=Gymnopilus junonius TaxID=109634 RepID=A0A9P5NHX2_GYMJU|nr:hypothetical protein CPB84DRAFT_1555614 [Gymnopilus junonius]
MAKHVIDDERRANDGRIRYRDAKSLRATAVGIPFLFLWLWRSLASLHFSFPDHHAYHTALVLLLHHLILVPQFVGTFRPFSVILRLNLR